MYAHLPACGFFCSGSILLPRIFSLAARLPDRRDSKSPYPRTPSAARYVLHASDTVTERSLVLGHCRAILDRSGGPFHRLHPTPPRQSIRRDQLPDRRQAGHHFLSFPAIGSIHSGL